MKAADFLLKLQENELIPFTEREQQLAVELAKEHTGRIVLREWSRWKRQNTTGFATFAISLPELIRENNQKIPPKYQDDPRGRMVNGKDPFAQVWDACRPRPAVMRNQESRNNTTPPAAGETAQETSVMNEDRFSNWEHDEVNGWHIGGVPIF